MPFAITAAAIISMLLTMVVYSAYIMIISFIVWMAVDAGKQDRFWWIVLIVGIPIIGAVAYYYTEKKHEYAMLPSHHIHTSETEEEHEKTPKKLTRNNKKAKKEETKVKEAVEEVKEKEVSVTETVVVEEKKGEGEVA